jgi:hypothetical protein
VILGLLVVIGVVAMPVVRAEARVAAYGRRGAVVVGRGGCCHSGGSVAGAAVAGLAVGAVAGAAAASASRPPVVVAPAPTVVVAPAPVVVAAPPPVAVGSVVYALPGGCTSVVVNGVNLMSCGSAFYQPVFQGGAVAYQVVPGP